MLIFARYLHVGKCEIIKERVSKWRSGEDIPKQKILAQMHRGTYTEMTRMADSYYTINRKLLLCLGVWPYQRFSFRCILVTSITMLLASSVIFQYATFITKEFSIELFLKILAYSIPWLGYLLRYNILCLNMKKLRDLIEQVHFDWNKVNDAHELEIIKKYSAIGRFITLVSTLSLYLFIFVFIMEQLIENFVLDFIISANESRVRQLPAEAECFVDQQKFFIPLLFGVFLIGIYGPTTVLAIETLFMSYTQHACGLFEVASCRIEQALHKGMTRDVISVAETNSIICQGIINAIDIHRKAIEFIEMSRVNFKWAYLVGVPLAVLSLSINLYRLSRLIATNDYQDTIITLLIVIGHFLYLFFCNYLGQEVIDHSGNIFHKTYNVQWYMAPLKVQKLLLLVMQRSLRHCTVMIGGLFVPSLEGFATLTNMSLSYFMVIYSMQ